MKTQITCKIFICFPIGLFTTNRWVTGEAWYRASDIIAMLDIFCIDHAYPSWPVNIWLTNLLLLFRPQVEWLLMRRDLVIDVEMQIKQVLAVMPD